MSNVMLEIAREKSILKRNQGTNLGHKPKSPRASYLQQQI